MKRQQFRLPRYYSNPAAIGEPTSERMVLVRGNKGEEDAVKHTQLCRTVPTVSLEIKK